MNKFSGDFKVGHRLLVAGIREMDSDSKFFYPDANFTMRLTYGTVGDYEPEDAVTYSYFTTLNGVMEKEDPDNWEFVVPQKLKELYLKNPEQFDPTRPYGKSFQFGFGHHGCIGKMIGMVMIPEMVRQVLLRPDLKQDSEADFGGGPFPQHHRFSWRK